MPDPAFRRPFVRHLRAVALLALLALGLIGRPARAQFSDISTAQVARSLVAEATEVDPAKPFTVALRMVHPEHYHTYWVNTAVGMPITVEWKLPAGFKAGPMQWAQPQLQNDEALGTQHVYEGTVHHLTDIEPAPGTKAGTAIPLQAEVVWQECSDTGCQQYKQTLSLEVKTGAATVYDPAIKAEFDKTRADQPVALKEWTVAVAEKPPVVTFTLTPGTGAAADPGEVYFFDASKQLKYELPKVSRDGGKIIVTATREDEKTEPIQGFFYAPKGWLATGGPKALALSAARPAASPTAASDSGKSRYVTVAGEEAPVTLWTALLFAFVGGMILNIMPCVFPVLGLKVFSFVRQAGEDPKKVKLHGLVFTLGVIVSIWILGGAIIAANAYFGKGLGWGAVLQYPVATALIVAVMFLLGLNLAGVFEMGTSLTTVGGDLQYQEGYAGSFFSGALTTIVATPCSGPFLGAAMTFTLAQPAPLALFIFTFFALGISAPYLILSISPGLIKKLPKPGPWMETFKKAMAFPMFGAAVFFLNTFATQTGVGGIIDILSALVCLGLAAWVYGHWCSPFKHRNVRLTGLIVLLPILGLTWWFADSAIAQRPPASGADLGEAAPGLPWEKWSHQRIAELRQQKKIVYVDFTAKWCATCQTNKKAVFHGPGSDALIAYLKANGVVMLKADWTLPDPLIAEEVKRFNRVQIPVNLIYPADPEADPVLLPSVLTAPTVHEALKKVIK